MSSAPDKKDFELFQQIKDGDRQAFRTLFDRYYKYLVVTSYNIQGDSEKARDLAQDVFLELWKKRSEINITSSLKAYLRRAVFNKTLNYIKAQRLDFNDDGSLNQELDRKASAQQMLEKEDLQDLVNKAIESLPEKCRLVFTLCRLEQMSHKEIAAQLNISTKTVENQMTKALKVLRVALQPYLSEGLLIWTFISAYLVFL